MKGEYRRIKIGKGSIEAFIIPLPNKNFILLKGTKGYVMCGYLNLKAAHKFKDAAVKIVGVSTINDALKAPVHSCTPQARKLGIHKNQPIKEALKLLV